MNQLDQNYSKEVVAMPVDEYGFECPICKGWVQGQEIEMEMEIMCDSCTTVFDNVTIEKY